MSAGDAPVRRRPAGADARAARDGGARPSTPIRAWSPASGRRPRRPGASRTAPCALRVIPGVREVAARRVPHRGGRREPLPRPGGRARLRPVGHRERRSSPRRRSPATPTRSQPPAKLDLPRTLWEAAQRLKALEGRARRCSATRSSSISPRPASGRSASSASHHRLGARPLFRDHLSDDSIAHGRHIQRTITPIDGRVYVERPLAIAARDRRRARARAQRRKRSGAGAPSPSARRSDRALRRRVRRTQGTRSPSEITWQMGRPIRYSAGRGARLRGARALHDRRRAARRSPISMPEPKPGFRRFIRREPLGVVLVDRALELPLPHRGQRGRAGADGRQRGDPQALARRRRSAPSASPRRSTAAGLPDGRVPGRALSHDDDRRGDRGALGVDHVAFTGSVAGGQRRAARRGRPLHRRRPRARRQGPGLRARRRRSRARGREPGRRRLLQLRANPAAASSASTSHETAVSSEFVDALRRS